MVSFYPRCTQYLSVVVSGYAFFACLIVSIGAQNVFVLRHGLAGRSVSMVVGICVLSDVTLSAVGILGVGTVINKVPHLLMVSTFAGALFLITYGVLALRRAFRNGEALDVHGNTLRNSTLVTAGICIAVTWLNPHVYLDTVMLLGSVANSHPQTRWWFGAGAALASITWFGALGFGARRLRPIFARPNAWRIFEVVVALVMFAVALSLLTKGLDFAHAKTA